MNLKHLKRTKVSDGFNWQQRITWGNSNDWSNLMQRVNANEEDADMIFKEMDARLQNGDVVECRLSAEPSESNVSFEVNGLYLSFL